MINELPEGARAHVGTTDVDLVISLSVADGDIEAYRTLEKNLRDAGFEQDDPSFRWKRDIDGITRGWLAGGGQPLNDRDLVGVEAELEDV